MPGPRITPVEPPYEPRVEEYLRKAMPPGVEPLKLFKTLAVNEEIATRMRPLGAGLLAHGALEPRDREVVIDRMCALAGAEYEWGVHAVFFAEQVGLTQEQLTATVHGDAADPAWSESDALLVRLCDEIHERASVSDELWSSLERHWQPAQLVELLVLAGWYRTIAGVINAIGIEREEWAARFPDAVEDR